ncbi:MAG: hypothetical protein LBR24_00335 [Methanobrevibacter sp.]|jgi:hypothetical protein|nr:hypothetical protein [Methanobrevibacter sp.]
MIKDKLKDLRQAAKVSTEKSSSNLWGIIAGNEEIIQEVSEKAKKSEDKVKIRIKQHIVIKDSLIIKKFDFIILYGETTKIRDLCFLSKEKGGAYIRIAPFYAENMENLLILIATDDIVKKFVNESKKLKIDLPIVLEDHTTGFIETDVTLSTKLPRFMKNVVDPLFNMTDVVLKTVLLSADSKEDVEKAKQIAKSTKSLLIPFEKVK